MYLEHLFYLILRNYQICSTSSVWSLHQIMKDLKQVLGMNSCWNLLQKLVENLQNKLESNFKKKETLV